MPLPRPPAAGEKAPRPATGISRPPSAAAALGGRTFDWPAFRREIARLARGPLTAGRDEERLAAAAEAVQQGAEAQLASQATTHSLVACGPGCGHCCVVNVAVLEPEAAIIARFLRREFPEPQLEHLRDRLDDLAVATRWLDDEERLMLRRSCAFLDEAGRCAIHPVRPLLCRRLTSIDPEDCRRAVAMHAFDEVVPITADLFQSRLFAEAFTCFGGVLKDLGMESRSVRLSEAVLQRLDSQRA